MGIAQPIGDGRNPDRQRARPARVAAERGLAIQGAGISGRDPAVIGVPPVDAVVSLGRRERVRRDAPPVAVARTAKLKAFWLSLGHWNEGILVV